MKCVVAMTIWGVMFLVISTSYVWKTDAQSISTSLCGTTYINQLPANINASVYAVESIADRLYLRRWSHGEIRDYEVPDEFQNNFMLRRPILSPDGRFVALRPIYTEADLQIWDLIDADVVTIPLDPYVAAELRGDHLTRTQLASEEFNALLGWKGSATLAIRTFAENTYPPVIIAEQNVSVANDSFILETAQPIPPQYTVDGSVLIDNGTPRIAPSPNGRYLAVSGYLNGSVQVLEVFSYSTNEVIFRYVSSVERRVVGEPLWVNDGEKLYFREAIRGQGFTHVLLSADTGFSRDTVFSSIVSGLSQYPVVAGGFPTTVSHDGTSIAFSVTSRLPDQPDVSQLAIYDVAAQVLTTLCLNSQVNLELGESFWSQNDRYIGLRLNGLILWDISTGDSYHFNGYVVGMTEG